MSFLNGLTVGMHPSIEQLAKELAPLADNAPERPTFFDHTTLAAVQAKIVDLPTKEPGEFGSADRRDLHVLFERAFYLLKKQTAFYEENGNKWAD